MGLPTTTLKNPREAQEWSKGELAKTRTAGAAVRRSPRDASSRNDNVPLLLHHTLAVACIEAGELTKEQAHVAESEAIDKPKELSFVEGEWELAGKRLFFEGEWELASKTLTAESGRSAANGSRAGELYVALDLARVHKFIGEFAQAAQVLHRALDVSLDGGDILFELATRSSLATMVSGDGDTDEALSHLERCRQIVGAGENWFGLAGFVERAEAVVATAQGEYSLAEAHFEKAIATFQHYCLPWEEADTLQNWGRALVAAGERARAIEKFDAAIEIYRSRGASARFVEYVMADQMRTQEARLN